MTPTQPAKTDHAARGFPRPGFDADAVRLRKDMEALAERCHATAALLPWNTYFDELIHRVPGPRSRRA